MEILVVGAGEIGSQLTVKLSHAKHNITVIESDPVKAAKAREQLDASVVTGSASSYKDLIAAGIKNMDLLAALSNNDEVNLIACRIAKKIGVPLTIARVRNPEYTSPDYILSKEELGADYIIQPEKQTAKAIVRLIRQSNATDSIDFDDGKVQLVGLRLDETAKILHTPLKELGQKYGNPPITIVAIKRRQYTIIPKGDDLLLKGDQIFFVCSPDFHEQALQYFGKVKAQISNIMIIGGGLIGEFIAKALENEMSIKIFESDQIKAEQLADKLDNTLVINGDGTDLDLLTFEGLTDMDEFIAVTGDDESNIITSLVAKHLEVPRTISLISNLDYHSLSQSIGLDAVISKQLITVNTVQKLIHGRGVEFLAELPGVDADIVELVAQPGSKIIKKPLMKISFPEKAIAGAIIRSNGETEVPKGLSEIQPGDKVVIFTLPEALNDVEKLFR